MLDRPSEGHQITPAQSRRKQQYIIFISFFATSIFFLLKTKIHLLCFGGAEVYKHGWNPLPTPSMLHNPGLHRNRWIGGCNHKNPKPKMISRKKKLRKQRGMCPVDWLMICHVDCDSGRLLGLGARSSI